MNELVPIHFLLGMLLLGIAMYYRFVNSDKALFRVFLLAAGLPFMVVIAERTTMHPYWLFVLLFAWIALGVYLAILTSSKGSVKAGSNARI
jgi:hypothetical protein